MSHSCRGTVSSDHGISFPPTACEIPCGWHVATQKKSAQRCSKNKGVFFFQTLNIYMKIHAAISQPCTSSKTGVTTKQGRTSKMKPRVSNQQKVKRCYTYTVCRMPLFLFKTSKPSTQIKPTLVFLKDSRCPWFNATCRSHRVAVRQYEHTRWYPCFHATPNTFMET